MVWCGFDDAMRSGIVEFARGVAKAITDKAAMQRIALGDQITREEHELRVLSDLVESHLGQGSGESPKDELRARAFLGMVSVARYLIECHRVGSDGSDAFSPEKDAFALGTMIQDFEREYEMQPPERGHEINAAAAMKAVFRTASTIPLAKQP